SKADPNDALKQGGRTDAASGGKRTRAVLVVTEVALSLVLLVGAGLMIRTLWNLRGTYPGFEASNVLTMDLGISDVDYNSVEQETAFLNQVTQRIRAIPGVESVGTADNLPLQGGSTQ